MASKATGIYGHWGVVASVAQLPNSAGATIQAPNLDVGDVASIGGALYICTSATLGAATWAPLGGGGGAAAFQRWTRTFNDPAGIVSETGTITQPTYRVAGVDWNGLPVVELTYAGLFSIDANGTPDMQFSSLPAPIDIASAPDIVFSVAFGSQRTDILNFRGVQLLGADLFEVTVGDALTTPGSFGLAFTIQYSATTTP